MVKHTWQVSGVGCQRCVDKIQAAVKGLDAAAVVDVDVSSGRVQVQSEQPLHSLQAALHQLGYPPVALPE
jgi:copper chaperone